MIDIVLDTNVLIASLLRPNSSIMRALRAIIGDPVSFVICYSSIMLAEYNDVLSRPVITGRGLRDEAEKLMVILEEAGEEIIPKPVYALVYPDRSDRPFLEAAVYVDGILLTNNLRDFPFAGVNVMAPDEFLEWLARRSRTRK
ncbi:MAG: putative toxin-antitoxin system toxin component, PIN family [Coriobacteriales bacterium]|jgi:putative PIN family toxin of toxin-antitoxin system|nr:putative toxin-antitoxin system toxin component, PIN family [Coriobacteriales bacterium]